VAGFGGQGILTVGRLLCTAAMREGNYVTYLPAYGPEARRGTANCNVVVSRAEICSPVVEQADSLVVLNELSFERFGDVLRPGGLLVLNAPLVKAPGYADSHKATVVEVPATERAVEMGNVVVANMIMLGAFIEGSQLCKMANIETALRESLVGPKSKYVDLNLQALAIGARIAADSLKR